MAKIFIGALVYAKRADVLNTLLSHVKMQFVDDWELHLIDTTKATAPELEPYAVLQKTINEVFGNGAKNIFIHTYTPREPHDTIVQHIADARERLRELFLESDSEYLFFLDDDVMLPNDAFAKLLSHNAPVACGVYLNYMSFEKTSLGRPVEKISPVTWITDPLDSTAIKPLLVLDVIPPRIIRIVFTGFGCALMQRKVIEQVDIYSRALPITEDIPFFRELDRLNILVLLDTSVKCPHVKYPIGDERNRYLDFANYKMQIEPK